MKRFIAPLLSVSIICAPCYAGQQDKPTIPITEFIAYGSLAVHGIAVAAPNPNTNAIGALGTLCSSLAIAALCDRDENIQDNKPVHGIQDGIAGIALIASWLLITLYMQ